ncbi:n-alkane-inducible cytochrome P450 [Teratosphaeria nubilosa]|uniref:N-alkane-inducible cytochrome P450 n=1 Tax=Teratosphaeria nubilosa TaxID=161662 RepID=A0A6G1LMK9_9PEZI|nr:n-alkane-inducible cytochrome P450 [Teratosphaeria nubilosa]
MAVLEILAQGLHLNTTAYLTLAVFLAYLCYNYYLRTSLNNEREHFKQNHGCQPAACDLKGDRFGLSFALPLIKAGREGRALEHFHGLHKKHGRTFRVHEKLLLTNDGANVCAALSGKFLDWAVRDTRYGAVVLLGDGAFTTDGAFWAHSRALLRPVFESRAVRDVGHFEKFVRDLCAHVPDADGAEVDLQDLFHRLAMDASTELLFGVSTASLGREGERAGRFFEAFDVALQECVFRARMRWMHWLVGFRPRAWRAIRESRRFVDEVVEKALEARGEEGGKEAFILQLARDERVDAGRIRDEAMNVLTAGRDTTAGLMSLLWFQLARRPDVWAKLRVEVDGLAGEVPTYERLMEMKYLRFCVNETLRLYPVVPVLAKTAIRDTVLPRGGGPSGASPIFVAKGTVLYYNMYSMHRSPGIYGADAESFRPERWADAALKPGWDFLPFGGGPRICLGQQYALAETYYVVVRLMQRFRAVEARGEEVWREKLTLTLGCRDGVRVVLRRE